MLFCVEHFHVRWDRVTELYSIVLSAVCFGSVVYDGELVVLVQPSEDFRKRFRGGKEEAEFRRREWSCDFVVGIVPPSSSSLPLLFAFSSRGLLHLLPRRRR